MLKAIPNLDGYYASSDGRIWSTKRNLWLKPRVGKKGYLYVQAGGKSMKVHRLVALAFIPNPDNLETVDHVNNIKTDNRPENLRWMTRSENSGRNKLKRVSCSNGKVYNSLTEASVDTGSDISHITKVCRGKLKSTNGLKFNYI